MNYDTEGNEWALKRLRIADGFVERLVDLKDSAWTDYEWSGLSLDGKPIILRAAAPEIYALELGRR